MCVLRSLQGGSSKAQTARFGISAMAETLGTYNLMKDAPGCTGMFWRADPRSGQKGTMDNWPRDGAQLKGVVHEVNGAKWLECKEVKQKGADWTKCSADQWMPFRYSQYYLEEA
ncbi:unnamed protein product [Symbiodinium sp. CCMP2592]|nr:unnamed protein product [Symbiodinium sp. CCMP2592]